MHKFIKTKLKIISAKEIREQNRELSRKHCTNNTGAICGKNIDVPGFHKIFSKGNKRNEDNKDK